MTKKKRLSNEFILSELLDIERRFGRIEPRRVVEEAKPIEAPLHPCFEWDDKKAAAAHRIQQARQLINTVYVKVEIEDRPAQTVRAMYATEDAKGEHYVSRDVLAQRPDLWAEAYSSIARHSSGIERDLEDLMRLARQDNRGDELARITLGLEILRSFHEAMSIH